ncbi:hypothetical protein [Runella sp.]|uniref:hypothetical protein n=1 Tax=Runella sp. TaxID=1960881 RepID=UPI00261949AA|nr:hypothetical protein [Runella sp.]
MKDPQKKWLYWMIREGYPSPIVTTLLGNQINLDASPAPNFPCVLSKDCTPIRPEGWR